MTLKYVAEIRDPIHGYIKITDEERQIIDSPFLQRLRRIHQLAGAYLVYPGGVHTRFEHVIGTMHVAGLIGQSVADQADLDDDDVQELRLAALLHDVGHGPFSHLFEEVLSDKTDLSHEDLSQRIVSESVIGDILKHNGHEPSRISKLCVGKAKGKEFMNQTISGGLSADMMDYLLRDTYFTGVEYGKVDIQRVIDSLSVSPDGQMMLERAALYAFEALLIARYEMFKAVYFHRTVRAAELMLAQSMTLADEELRLTELSSIDRMLKLTDEVILQQLADLPPRTPELRSAKNLAMGYMQRRLVKCVFEKVMQRKDRTVQKIFSKKRLRDQLACDIARSAGVEQSDIYIDVPNTPSVPYTHERQAFNSVTIFSNEPYAHPSRAERVPASELPLVGSITGFMDILRVYTSTDNRKEVMKAAEAIFGKEDFMSQISL
ncbi:MAG: HD domain-containing protein [Nitrososphaerota archaeon]|jgi:HD superfamily phosphohydrolase|nr:HD domain-containing protein [Nitrososphaerota archaeon]